MLVLTRSQVRSLDQIAVERFLIPSIVLMENAGKGATDCLFERIPGMADSPTVAVLAGRGNNGGDGFVVARHLALRGVPVEILLLGRREDFRRAGDAGTNFAIVESLGLAIHPVGTPEALEQRLKASRIVIDAMLGTGLAGAVRGLVGQCIDVLNDSGAH